MVNYWDLRLGSWLYSKNRMVTGQVTTLEVSEPFNHFVDMGGNLDMLDHNKWVHVTIEGKNGQAMGNPDYFEGIPITPELLHKFHHEVNMKSEFYTLPPDQRGGDVSYMGRSVQYVHQLQNVFLELTGKELEINP